ncbi:MAG: MFS transporter [Chloroflexi bacterium]|nr:MFS transporter [Chloroflexota bacterium]
MTPREITRSYYWIAGLYTLSASLIWGVNTLFLLDAGLNIGQVFIANAFYTVGTVLFEIPTGVVADTLGRRVSFLLSAAVLVVATLGYVAGSLIDAGLLWFMVFSVFLGLGFTFYSGAVEAWLVDALDATGYEGELDNVFARSAQITGAAMLIGSVGGGLIGTINIVIPFAARAAMLAMVFVVAFHMMHDIGYEPKPLTLQKIPVEMRRLAADSVRFGWTQPQLRMLMLVAFIQYGFMGWAFYAWQPYFLELFGDPDAVWIAGLVTAGLSLSTIVGNVFVDWYTRHDGRRTTFMIGALAVFIMAMVGVGLANSFLLAVGLLLLGMAAAGAMGPVRQSYIHHVIPAEQRASVLSVDSMFASGGGILLQSGLCQVALNIGIGPGYIIGGGLTALGLPLLAALRGMNGEADFIVREPGHTGGLAAQGLPAVTAVDAKPCAQHDPPGAGEVAEAPAA